MGKRKTLEHEYGGPAATSNAAGAHALLSLLTHTRWWQLDHALLSYVPQRC